MTAPIISVENLGKRYVLRHQRSSSDGVRHILEEAVRTPFRWLRSRRAERTQQDEEFWALRDVCFEVNKGDVVGIIGRNGAGKSTLLKILSRITEPTCGRVHLRGRVASLLEVGTGFHPELTGRENIFLNGAILGMSRIEIKQKFDEIVAFAEVERFLDTPVKRYSSGMYVRLAFAVAAHLEPEILVIDEVLAVGDAAFQKKCLTKMGEVAREGRTVLFVSHNMAAVTALCTRGILIDGGQLVTAGPPHATVEKYLSQLRSRAGTSLASRTDRKGMGRIRFTDVAVLNDRGEAVEHVSSGQDISFSFSYGLRDEETLRGAVVQLSVSSVLGQPLFACLSRAGTRESIDLVPGGRLVCHIPRLPLLPGIYGYSIWCKTGEITQDWITEAGTLSVAEGDYFGTGKLPSSQVGEVLVSHHWSAKQAGLLQPVRSGTSEVHG